ncbi:MAG: CdaR family protein [Christensenellales bacterium]
MKNFGKNVLSVFKRIWGVLGRNFGLKLIALFFAVLLWSIAMAEENPWREKNLSNVPVTVTGKDVLEDNGLAVTQGLAVLEKGIRLNLEVRQADYYTVENESISASADLSFIRQPGQYTVKVNTKGLTNGRVLDINPSTIEVTVEKTTARMLPVIYKFEGETDPNYWHGEPKITPDIIEIKGPVSLVEKVSSAVCIIPLTELTETFHEAVQIMFYDSNGEIVDVKGSINSIPTVIVQMDVLYKKNVPVRTNGNILDIENVKAGYFVSDVAISPKNVEIIGPIDKLVSIDGLDFEAFSVQRQSSTIIANAALILPEGVEALNTNTINVIVTIKEKDTESVFNKQLQYTDLEKGFKAVLGIKVIEVKVKGPLSVVKNFQPSDLQLYVNLAGLTKGTYDIPVEYSITDGNSALEINISPALVKVVIE